MKFICPVLSAKNANDFCPVSTVVPFNLIVPPFAYVLNAPPVAFMVPPVISTVPPVSPYAPIEALPSTAIVPPPVWVIVPLFIATSPTAPSVALDWVPVTSTWPLLVIVELSAIIALTEAPVAEIFPVFVDVPAFCANIPVDLSAATVISAAVVIATLVNIPILSLPDVILIAWSVPEPRTTVPCFTKTPTSLFPFTSNLYSFKLNVFDDPLSKYTPVLLFPERSNFIIDALDVPGNVVTILFAVLLLKGAPPSRSIQPLNTTPAEFEPETLIALFNKISAASYECTLSTTIPYCVFPFKLIVPSFMYDQPLLAPEVGDCIMASISPVPPNSILPARLWKNSCLPVFPPSLRAIHAIFFDPEDVIVPSLTNPIFAFWFVPEWYCEVYITKFVPFIVTFVPLFNSQVDSPSVLCPSVWNNHFW